MPRTREQKNNKQQIELKVDLDRIQAVLTLDELVGMGELFSIANRFKQASEDEDQSAESALPFLAEAAEQLRLVRRFLAKMVWKDDRYLEVEEALPIVGKLTVGQLLDALMGLMAVAGDQSLGNTNKD